MNPTYEYKTSIEICLNNWRKEVPVTLICEIWGDYIEVVNMIYDDSKEQNSDYMLGLLKEIWDQFDFDHLQDEILSEVIAEREADRVDRIMDDMKSPELEPLR